MPPNDPGQAVQGEQAMSASDMQGLVPDLVSPKGQQMVQGLVTKASSVQPKLDNTLKLIAAQAGLDPNKDFESRIKNPDTVTKKVAVHRKDGKEEYKANDVNDMYGARFIADTPDQKKEILQAVKELGKNNWLKIDKEEHVDHGTYHSHHVDFNKDGVKGEIQIHDPASLFEAVINHEIRAKYGENVPPEVAKVKKFTSQIGYHMQPDQAQNLAQAIQLQRIQQQKGVSTNG